jgi:hypothetical protein
MDHEPPRMAITHSIRNSRLLITFLHCAHKPNSVTFSTPTNDLTRQSKEFSSAAEIALIYAGLGENEQAMTWLEKAYSKRFNPSILLRPAFDPLRSDPRRQNFAHRIGLPL